MDLPTEVNQVPAANILIPAAVVFTGGTFEQTKQFARALNLNFVNKDQFYETQRFMKQQFQGHSAQGIL